ncbi:MAG: GNAT family N-acetyltransferase [Acidimicrobiia bacterium]|nr:GNAT family N-acetyltransferase [Acidimicrobiia bacterium]
MDITVRAATEADIGYLVDLYRDMEAEQVAKKPIWALTDGLDEPYGAQLSDALEQPESWLWIGEIDGVTVGFAWVTIEEMLDRAGGRRLGRIRLIYTTPDARGVGVGHAVLTQALDTLRAVGISAFDAPAGPGQRAAKNFFEAHGFAARSIVMHSADTGAFDA